MSPAFHVKASSEEPSRRTSDTAESEGGVLCAVLCCIAPLTATPTQGPLLWYALHSHHHYFQSHKHD
ncbi:hypothetical protein E2C01_033312 [Portunus trituberculatus]|uniref:Uncharacterized protein n=1 Tax=Portunus trituberculatus TaxID=210409 RepID=A0A5B7F3W0_PORTR|nr:hypothetical protein [Portunus trituberculatus]